MQLRQQICVQQKVNTMPPICMARQNLRNKSLTFTLDGLSGGDFHRPRNGLAGTINHFVVLQSDLKFLKLPHLIFLTTTSLGWLNETEPYTHTNRKRGGNFPPAHSTLGVTSHRKGVTSITWTARAPQEAFEPCKLSLDQFRG